ncbi:BgtE-20034 [Blumeria graminis f. sp. tritici]|uniref:BgtE-20034 n=2 Tax=Blumeria graminis f. sp. tritici TaxID=62690 RepID=A0A381L1N2_BLUGR|nr:BgtE-20034 [Blumeria graminis f. sp. tritici]
MKFLGAASTLVFSGLVLSASAFLPGAYFLCSEDRKIFLSAIDHHENPEFYLDAEHDDPLGPDGRRCSAYRYSVIGNDGSTIMTLIQATSESPFNRVLEKIGGVWRQCPFYLRE